MNNKGIFSGDILMIGGIIVFITGIGLYLFLKHHDKPKSKQFPHLLDKSVLEKDKFVNNFNIMLNHFKKISLSYCLYREAQINRLTEKKSNELFLRYGKLLAEPDLDLLKYFGYLNEEYYKVDDYIIEFLKNNLYKNYSELLPVDRLKRNILDESEKEAKDIIKYYL